MRKVLLLSCVQQRLERLEKGLGDLGIDVRTASSSANVWPLLLGEPFDAIIVDASSSNSELDPWILCGELREAFKIPTIVLIRSGRNKDRLRAFRAGARQCLAVPVSPTELCVSLDMVLTPDPPPNGKAEPENLRYYSDAWLAIDLSKRRVCRGNVTNTLTFKEFLLLDYLMREQGNVVPLEKLSDAVWNQGEREKKCNRLKAYISRLRQKIEEDPTHPQYIISQHGFGYAFIPQNQGLNL